MNRRTLAGCMLASALAAASLAPARGAAAPRDESAAPDATEADELGSEFVEYVEVDTSALPRSNTVATKLPVPLAETPAHVGVVPGVVLDEQRATVLGDALTNVSGINVVGGSGVHDFFVVRGFDSLSSGLVMTDGAAEPEVSFYQTYNVEGIEVLKGPAGFLYGKDPLAGVVNIVRKQPLPADLGRVSLWGGSFGTQEARLDWNEASGDGDLAFRLNGMWQRSDRWRDVTRRAHGPGDPATRHVAINPGLTWRFGEASRLNLNLELVDAEHAPDSGVPLVDLDGDPLTPGLGIPDVPRERSYQSPFDDSDQRITRFQADLETRVSDRVTLRNKSYFRGLDWETDGTVLLGVFDLPLPPEFGGGVLPDQVVRTLTRLDDRQRYLGNQWEAALELTTGRITHRLLAGVEVARLTDDFALQTEPQDGSGLPPIDLYDPVETAVAPSVVPFLVGESTADVVAPYVIDQIGFSEAVQLMVGLRYDDIDTEVDYAVSPAGFGTDFDRDDSELSPMAGLMVRPGADWSVYANAGQSYSPIGPRVRGAATLEPERSRQFELGAKKQFAAARARVSMAVYRIDRENIAITDPSGLTQNAGDQRSEGFELELAAEFWPRLRTLLAYGYNDSELTRFTDFDPVFMVPVDFSGNTPAFAPEHLGRLWVSHHFRGGLGLGGGLRWFSEQYIGEDNLFEIDGALLVDLSATCDWRDLRFRLDLRNATDEDYETRGVGSSRSTAVVPAEPAALYGGVEYRF